MFSNIQKFCIFPFLFGIFPIILLYSDNVTEIRISDFLLPLFLTLFIILILFILLKFIIKNDVKSGFIITLLTSIFFSYGYIFNMLQNSILNDLDLIHHRYMLIPFILFSIIGVFYIIRTNKNLNDFRQIFNVISLVMILSVSIPILIFYPEDNSVSEFTPVVLNPPSDFVYPDIYHIVLDEYTSDQVLKNDFQFNNSDFITNLKNQNFILPSEPLSNYPHTEPFLSSTLNLQYLDDSNLEKYERLKTENTINDNFVMHFLKKYDYQIIVPYSGYGPPDKFLNSDVNPCSNVIFMKNKFLTELSRTTIINYFVEKQIEQERRKIQLCALSELPDFGKKNDKPVYVFTHLFIPHAPYLFDKDGNFITPSSNKLKGLEGWNNVDGYLNEIQFINKKILTISKNILTYSKNSIIIIQGDTGSSILNNPDTDDFIKKRLSILFAIHLPDAHELIFPNTTSSPNTYRIIFNHYFGTNYDLLPDQYYWDSNSQNIVNGTNRYIDVTDLIIPLSEN